MQKKKAWTKESVKVTLSIIHGILQDGVKKKNIIYRRD